MINQETINKLIEMRLSALAEALKTQMQDKFFADISFDERFGMLVDIEFSSRKNNRLKRIIKRANFDQPQADIADINYSYNRKLDKTLISQLSCCSYISESYNVIIMGATGSGKSYLACALGMEACKRFYSVNYIRLPELLAEMAVARVQGSFSKVLNQYKKVSLLILDEWMLIHLTDSEARDLFELIHSRHKHFSTIFCSQFSPAGWHEKIGEATIADAILDRIVHDSYIIEIQNGKNDVSMREIYGLKNS
jgi:DNA replication protein DnaC